MPIKTLFFAILSLIAVPSFCADSNSSPGKSKEYTVQKGDSLWTISYETWGNSSKWPLLYAANQEIIHDPNLILPGQQLSIPSSIAKGQLQKAMELVARDFPKPRKPSKSSPSVSQKPKNPTLPQEKPTEISSPPAAAEPSKDQPPSSNHSLILIVLAILILIGGFTLWFRKRSGASPQTKKPEPIVSFKPPPPNYDQPSAIRPPPPPVQVPTPTPKPIEPLVPPPSPSTLTIADSAADTYIGQGRFMEAAKIYRAILETDPGNVEIGKKLIRVENLMRIRTAELASSQTPASEPKPSEPATFSGTMTSISTPSTSPLVQPAPVAPPVETKPPESETPPASSTTSPEIKPPSDSLEPPK